VKLIDSADLEHFRSSQSQTCSEQPGEPPWAYRIFPSGKDEFIIGRGIDGAALTAYTPGAAPFGCTFHHWFHTVEPFKTLLTLAERFHP
jgi:hypothetical protein